jgi:hypothetical protein
MFRFSRDDLIDNAETIEDSREIVRGQPPGRYHVDEIRAEPFACGHTSRAWGHLIRDYDGAVVDEPHTWPEQTSIG